MGKDEETKEFKLQSEATSLFDVQRSFIKIDKLVKSRNSVMPAKAGIQNYLKILDSRLRGNDVKGRFKTYYETIKITPYDINVTRE